MLPGMTLGREGGCSQKVEVFPRPSPEMLWDIGHIPGACGPLFPHLRDDGLHFLTCV